MSDREDRVEDLVWLLEGAAAYLAEVERRPEEGLTLIQRACRIAETIYDDNDPRVASAVRGYARVLSALGRHHDAAPLLERALAIHENVYGREHPEVAEDLRDLANVLAALGRHHDAAPLLERALAIHENVYGREHPEVAEDLRDLANVLAALGRHHDAAPLLERALGILRIIYGSAYFDVKAAWDILRMTRLSAVHVDTQGFIAGTNSIEDRISAESGLVGFSGYRSYKLSDVFKRNGVPTVTFVEPPDFPRFRAALTTLGRGIIIEGPSGIGKTTFLRQALSHGKVSERRLQILSGRAARDRALIEQLPQGHAGIAAVDDFHRLPADLRYALVDYLKILADEESDNRLILVGIPGTGQRLVELGFDVITRVDVFRLPSADNDLILKMISQGSAALNIQFSHPDQIVSAAAGSLLVAQMICWELAVLAGIDGSQAALTHVAVNVDRAIEQAWQSCRAKYDSALAKFAMLDGPDDTTCLAILAELMRSVDGILDLNELRRRPDLRRGIDGLIAKGTGNTADLEYIGQHMLYEPEAGRLLVEDPQLMFYLRQQSIDRLAASVGKRLPAVRDQIFVSYSHRDRGWLDRLQIHLRPLVRDGRVDLWADTRLQPGDRWRDEIAVAIDRAKAAILLISADFLASDFVDRDELPPLLHAAENHGCTIIPLIVGPSLFQQTRSLSAFQAINDPSRPLSAMSRHEQEQVLQSVAARLISPVE